MARRSLDRYYTPRTATQALLAHCAIQGSVLEPCVGTGAISQELARHGSVSDVWTNDIDPNVDAHQYKDATDPEFWTSLEPDWVVSNPPFLCCHPIIVGAFSTAQRGVAMFLRLSYLEPCNDRAEFLSRHPPSLIVLPRISFTGDGKSDSVTCAWMIWDKMRQDTTVRIVTKQEMAHISNTAVS